MSQVNYGITSIQKVDGKEPIVHGSEMASEDAAASQAHKSLLQWALENGGSIHPKVQLAHTSSKGFHVLVVDDGRVDAETNVATCPISLSMSAMNAFDLSPFHSHGTSFPSAFLESNFDSLDIIQTFYLMEQHVLASKSWWYPYIKTLPDIDEIQDLQFESLDDLRWIEGTNFKSGLVMQMNTWLEKYEEADQQLKKLLWPSSVEEKYSWKLYRWAATMFGSRSFTSSLLGDSTLAQNIRSGKYTTYPGQDIVHGWFTERFAVLFPVLDLLNHQPMTKVEWQAQESHVGIKVLHDYTSGQEICNNYGLRDNEALLLAYGFVIESNPFDHVVISIRAPLDSPLVDIMSWRDGNDSRTNIRCYMFNDKHPNVGETKWMETSIFSLELLESISVLCANDRELQVMYANEETLLNGITETDYQVEDSRNLIATISQIQRDCEGRLARLKASDPENLTPPQTPQNQKQKYAQIYRKSQISILDTSVGLCTLILVHVSTDWSISRIMSQCELVLEPDIQARLKHLATGRSFITEPHELLTVQQLASSLSTGMVTEWRRLQKFLDEDVIGKARDVFGPCQPEKVEFATFLSFLYVQYEQDQLTSRLKSWVEQLIQWYPPENEDWSSIPSEEDDAPPALLALLQSTKDFENSQSQNILHYLNPQRLCWGWNVAEQESVVISRRILEMVLPGGFHADHDVTLLMYCKNE